MQLLEVVQRQVGHARARALLLWLRAVRLLLKPARLPAAAAVPHVAAIAASGAAATCEQHDSGGTWSSWRELHVQQWLKFNSQLKAFRCCNAVSWSVAGVLVVHQLLCSAPNSVSAGFTCCARPTWLLLCHEQHAVVPWGLEGLSDGCDSSRGTLGFELCERARPTAAVGAGPLLLATAAAAALVGLSTRAVHLAAAGTVRIAVGMCEPQLLLCRAVAWSCAIAVADGACLLLLLLLQVTCAQPQGTATYQHF